MNSNEQQKPTKDLMIKENYTLKKKHSDLLSQITETLDYASKSETLRELIKEKAKKIGLI